MIYIEVSDFKTTGINGMTIKRINKYGLLTSAILLSLSTTVLAMDEAKPVLIPVIDNAHVFANYTDDMPAVLNYFTSASEDEIIDFYNQNYGESVSQERKRDRLTLTYKRENKSIRVVISQQNSKRQVDIIMENTPS